MRAREFVIERSQLNEVAPLALLAPLLPASLAWIASASLLTVAGWAVSAYFAYDTGKEILNAYNEHGSDLDQWPQELKDELLGNIIATALFSAVPALKEPFKKAWKGIGSAFKKEAFDSVAPKLKQEAEKSLKKSAVKDPNKVERPFSKEPATATSATKDPNRIERPFSKEPATATPAPKNPNWTEKPYQKESLAK